MQIWRSQYEITVSIYSSSGSISGLDSYNNSPSMPSFMIPPASSPSSSPHMSTLDIGAGVGGIRLPNAPLNDVVSLQQQQLSPPLSQQNGMMGMSMDGMMSPPLPPLPRKSATDPFFNTNGLVRSSSPAAFGLGGVGAVGMVRRGSAPVEPSHRASPMMGDVPIALPEVGLPGWQVGMGGVEDSMMVRSRSSSRSSVAA